MEIQEDYGHTDNPRDNCSALFPQEYKASLQQVPTDVSTEGPLIHILHQAMLDLLKQVMSRFLKQSVVKERLVNELSKVDSKNMDFQLKDDELDVGNETKKAINDIKQSGKQRQCFLRIRSFFTTVVAYMQKSLEQKNPLVEAM